MTERSADQTDAVPGELEALRERVAALDARNSELQARLDGRTSQRPLGRAGSVLGAILIVMSLVLAPVAVIGTWARAQLVDTERFVATFAPLAQDPDVQRFIAQEVTAGIEQNLDIDGLVGDLFDGLSRLDLPPRAQAAIPLLAAPAAAGARSLIAEGVDAVVTSPAFAQLWTAALRESHAGAIAVIQGDPNASLQLDGSGTLSLSLGNVIAQVKQLLLYRGLTFAAAIPEFDRDIPIVSADALTTVRVIYRIAAIAGSWLPWLLLGAFALGVCLVRRKLRALALGGLGLAVVLLLQAAGIGIAGLFFVSAVSPSVMPEAAANAIFGRVSELAVSSILSMSVLGIVVAVAAWIGGASRPARALRDASAHGFGAVRAAADRHGLGTGRFGTVVERWRLVLIGAAAVVAVLLVFLSRPATVASVLWSLALVVAVLLTVELLRRPAPDVS